MLSPSSWSTLYPCSLLSFHTCCSAFFPSPHFKEKSMRHCGCKQQWCSRCGIHLNLTIGGRADGPSLHTWKLDLRQQRTAEQETMTTRLLERQLCILCIFLVTVSPNPQWEYELFNLHSSQLKICSNLMYVNWKNMYICDIIVFEENKNSFMSSYKFGVNWKGEGSR